MTILETVGIILASVFILLSGWLAFCLADANIQKKKLLDELGKATDEIAEARRGRASAETRLADIKRENFDLHKSRSDMNQRFMDKRIELLAARALIAENNSKLKQIKSKSKALSEVIASFDACIERRPKDE